MRHKYGRTPLHYACSNGKIEAVECLIKHGAQIDMQDRVSDELYMCYH